MKKYVLSICMWSILSIFFSFNAYAQSSDPSSSTGQKNLSGLTQKNGITGVSVSVTLSQRVRACQQLFPNCPNNSSCPNYPNCPRNGLKNKKKAQFQNGNCPGSNGQNGNGGSKGGNSGRGRGGKGGGKGGGKR